DDLEKTALKLARPTQAALSILPPDRASNNIVQGRYADQKIFIITREPEALVEMVEAGVPIKEVNVGNLPSGEGRLQLFKSVGVNDEEIKAFKELDARGVKLYHQMVPNDPREDFMSELNKRMEK
ncbi:PTS sugar transporter subunit IIB, partial [Lactobacillus sp. M0390]